MVLQSNNNGPELLVLAAGLGSRYGGFKQLDSFGPEGETIMDYSINDAIDAGFSKIVLVINRQIEKEINETIVNKYRDRIKINCISQDLDLLPEGFPLPKDRKKPWGTAHAIYVAKDQMQQPFAVINADDFYGRSAFFEIKKALTQLSRSDHRYCMVGYKLKNTLSKFGGVSRGWCALDGELLTSIAETEGIERKIDGQIIGSINGKRHTMDQEEVVSMNFWGFTPSVFEVLETRFKFFLKHQLSENRNEFYITDVIDYLLKEKLGSVSVIKTDEKWFGVTYKEDREEVKAGIREIRKTM